MDPANQAAHSGTVLFGSTEWARAEARRMRGEGKTYIVIAKALSDAWQREFTPNNARLLVTDMGYQPGVRRQRQLDKKVPASQLELGLQSVAEQKLAFIKTAIAQSYLTDAERLETIGGILK